MKKIIPNVEQFYFASEDLHIEQEIIVGEIDCKIPFIVDSKVVEEIKKQGVREYFKYSEFSIYLSAGERSEPDTVNISDSSYEAILCTSLSEILEKVYQSYIGAYINNDGVIDENAPPIPKEIIDFIEKFLKVI